jgi:acyl-CoA synthetase (AMP-forming)/AMP-acid ligase II
VSSGRLDDSGVTRGPDGVKRYAGLPLNLVHMLRDTVARHPDREAVVETGGGPRLSYRQLWERAGRVAGGLRAAGVQRGDRAAIRLGNGADWVLAFWGTVLAGAVVVPVNTRFTEDEAGYVVGDSGARYVFATGAPLPDGEPLCVEDLGEHDPAAIFYTSGTTGFPKGAVTTHENFMSNCESCRRILGVPVEGTNPRTLISVPLFHVTGCNSQLLVALYLGGTTVVLPQFEVGAFLDAIEEERIDTLTTVPAIYWLAINQPRFAKVDVSRIRSLSYGGAPIAPELVYRIMKAFPAARVGNGFGLTETASVATYLPHEFAEHADSVGFPVPVCDVKLDQVTDDGVGELLIRGPNVVAGYWNKPAETTAAFTDGWLRSGDLARIDDDGSVARLTAKRPSSREDPRPSGLVYVVDRAKDMINRGGENVYCVEVENALAGAPGVFEAAVVGVPDTVMGEKVGAVLVPAPGGSIDVPAVLDYLAERIADFKIPQYVVVRPEALPRNPGGKLLKRRLRDETAWADGGVSRREGSAPPAG